MFSIIYHILLLARAYHEFYTSTNKIEMGVLHFIFLNYRQIIYLYFELSIVSSRFLKFIVTKLLIESIKSLKYLIQIYLVPKRITKIKYKLISIIN